MGKKLEITLTEFNKIKYEKLDEFSKSIFRDVYAKAFDMVQRLINDNCTHIKLNVNNGKKNSLEIRNSEQIYNSISFLGERGMGKSSSMLSFVAALEHECGINMSEAASSTLKDLTGSKHLTAEVNGASQSVAFSALDYVDATMLEQKESVLEVILAKMWDKFETFFEQADISEDIIEFRKLKGQFKRVRDCYLFLNKMSRGTIDDDREISSLDALHKLAASMNLRDELKSLVKNYLEFVCYRENGSTKTINFLVITIDDIDMGVGSTYKLLEQLRRFLTIPQVLIFLSADLKRLKRICNNFEENLYENSFDDMYGEGNAIPFCDRHRDSNLKKEQEKFINDYFGKLIPLNNRNYIPNFKELGGGLGDAWTIPIMFEKEERLSEKNAIIKYMGVYMGLYFDGSVKGRHIFQSASMREFVNYLNDMFDMGKKRAKELKNGGLEDDSPHMKQMLEWLKNDLKYRLSEKITDHEQRNFFTDLFLMDSDEINERLIRFIYHLLKREDESESEEYWDYFKRYGSNFSIVMTGCYYLESVSTENKAFCSCVMIFYTWLHKVIELNICEGSTSDIIQGNALGSWMISSISLRRLGNSLTSINMKSKLNAEIYFDAEFIESITPNYDGSLSITLDEFRLQFEGMLKKNMEKISCLQMLMYQFSNAGDWNVELDAIEIVANGLQGLSDGKSLKEEYGGIFEKPRRKTMKINLNPDINLEFGIMNFINNLDQNQFPDGEIWMRKLTAAILDELKRFVLNDTLIMYFEDLDAQYFDADEIDLSEIYKDLFSEQCKVWKKDEVDWLPCSSAEIMYNIEKQLHRKISKYVSIGQPFEYTKKALEIIQEELKLRDFYFTKCVDHDGLGMSTSFEANFISCPFVEKFFDNNGTSFQEAYNELANMDVDKDSKVAEHG